MRSLLPDKSFFLPLLFLSYLHMGLSDSQEAAQPHLVIQPPAALKVMEGSTLRMECLFQGNILPWFIIWHKIENGTKDALSNTSRMSIILNKENRSSCLILNKTEVADSGIYQCEVGSNLLSHNIFSNGTQLIVDAITDLMVNQTPEHINQSERTNVTIECHFRTVSDHNSTDVRWYRNGTKLNSTDSLRIKVAPEKGLTSLILKNATANDSGVYACQVRIASRNLTGSGNTTKVHITTVARKTEPNEPLGTGVTIIGAWAGAGAGAALLVLVVAGVIIWRWKSKGSRSEPDTPPAKETGLHPPLVGQPSDVTYADLRFQKKEVQPDVEVVYAEVKVPRK